MPYADINGVKTYYEDTGKGEVLLFLHCWTGNHSFWKNQVEFFKNTHRCLTMDFRGHGKSQIPLNPPLVKGEIGEYDPVTFCRDVYGLITRLGLESSPIILAGHSMGGMVALQFVLDHPQLVKGMVLVDTTPKLTGQIFQNVATLFATPLSLFSPAWGKKATVDFTALHPLTDRSVRKFIKDEIIKVSNVVTSRSLKAMRKFDVTYRLDEIKVPTLILVGIIDIFTDIRHARKLKRGIKNSRLRIIRGASHMTILEQPDEVNERLNEFLAGLRDDMI